MQLINASSITESQIIAAKFNSLEENKQITSEYCLLVQIISGKCNSLIVLIHI